VDANIINPFISSTMNVLTTMASVNPTAGKPTVKPDNKSWGVVTGIIGLASNKIRGTMILSFDEPSILKIVNNMLGENYTAINDEIVDAVGELTNMICGGVKKQLGDLGMLFDLATPLMLVGQGVELKSLTKAPIISIAFEIPEGKFVIEANLADFAK